MKHIKGKQLFEPLWSSPLRKDVRAFAEKLGQFDLQELRELSANALQMRDEVQSCQNRLNVLDTQWMHDKDRCNRACRIRGEFRGSYNNLIINYLLYIFIKILGFERYLGCLQHFKCLFFGFNAGGASLHCRRGQSGAPCPVSPTAGAGPEGPAEVANDVLKIFHSKDLKRLQFSSL